MQRASRGLLWAWTFISLILVSYAVSLILASVPASSMLTSGMRRGEHGPFTPDSRLVLEPAGLPVEVSTSLGDPDSRFFGEPGSVLIVGNGTGRTTFPGVSGDARLARAIAWVEWNDTTAAWDVPALGIANVTEVPLSGVPYYNATTGARARLAFNFSLSGTPANVSGFIAKGDAEETPLPQLVPPEEVQGVVAKSVPARVVWTALGVSILGTILPVALLIRGQRPLGRPGMKPVLGGDRCPECGAEVKEDLGFCLDCGALAKRRPPS